MDKNSVHKTGDRKSKELLVHVEWILYSNRLSKYRLKYDLLLTKAASKKKIYIYIYIYIYI